jgi:outer membrane protein OmpA-like peptidoglycan-associated protein
MLAVFPAVAADPDLLALIEEVAALPPDDRDTLAALGPDLLALQVSGVSQAEVQIRNINRAIATAAQQEDALVSRLQAELGGVVRGIRGEILSDGTIVLPEEVVFEQGLAVIRPDLEAFLHGTCTPWIGLLRDSGLDIGTVEIQGHASPEWRTGTTEDAAYRNNLVLSQERARNVLSTCLDQVTDPELAAWARTHLVAVGYSSGRPVLVDGVVDANLSRRVEFSFRISRDAILDDIRTEMGAPAE